MINWTWTNPADDDFSHTTVYLDGVWETNTSDAYYNATGLIANTSYELSTRTVDTNGNVNTAWVNQTAATSAPAANGALSGTITSTTDGTGVSGVTVNLTLNSTRTVIASTTTDSNGDYLMTDLTPGEYTLTASKIRFWSDSTSVVTVNSTVTANCALWLRGDLNNN